MNGWFRVSLITILITIMSASWSFNDVKADEDDMVDGDVITIDYSGYKKERKGPVDFTHKKHAMDYKMLCWECHHEYKDDEKKWGNKWSPWGEIKTCDECHDPLKKQDKIVNLQKAFHINCKICHKTLAEQKKKAGPYKKCKGCHQKMEN